MSRILDIQQTFDSLLHMQDYRFRKVDLTVISELVEISISTFRETYAHNTSAKDLEDYISKSFSPDTLKKEIQNPCIHYQLIVTSNEILGYSKLEEHLPPVSIPNSKVIELARIYLRKKYWNQGLGEPFLNQQFEVSRQLNMTGIWLSVWIENKQALRFYEKHGFQTIGEQTFMVGDDPQKDIILFKSLV